MNFYQERFDSIKVESIFLLKNTTYSQLSISFQQYNVKKLVLVNMSIYFNFFDYLDEKDAKKKQEIREKVKNMG